jgi:exosortase/archaeosortase family protein
MGVLVVCGAYFVMPQRIFEIPAIADLFAALGHANAVAFSSLLSSLGFETAVMGPTLHLEGETAMVFSPYCFGLLSISALLVLALLVPGIPNRRRGRLILLGGGVLVIANQLRILVEVLVTVSYPPAFPGIDALFSPVLPGLAFYLWYRWVKLEIAFQNGGIARNG